MWVMPKIWDGGECWIIGGGPSIVKQFEIPSQLVNKVRTGVKDLSIYSPYMAKLHDRHIIGVNMAYKLGNWVDIMYFGDASFFDRIKREIHKFPGLVVTARMKSQSKLPGIKMMRRKDKSKTYGITTEPGSIRWNTNSGGAAINLAYHTGVKRIYLLGFDMDNAEDGQRHWHNEYGKKSKPAPYKTHSKCFPKIAEDAEKIGLEIINVNPDSKITCFPKKSLSEVL